MAKKRITKKEVVNTHKQVFRCGAASLQFLFNCREPYAYTCGVYGWNADIYSIGAVAIVSGYRPFGVEIPRDMIERYENEARNICNETWLFDDRAARLNDIIDRFYDELKTI